MARVGLIIGSNLEDRLGYMEKAVSSLGLHVGKLLAKSSIYVSPPWGYESTNEYYNQVLLFDTSLEPAHLLHFCLRIEKLLGRVRKDEKEGYSDRTIDIDILYYDNLTLEEDNLIIPHPRMHQRKFCLLPLFEVNPDWVHPVYQKDLVQLIDSCTDDSDISRLS
ncbi:2-amino-4-hydroxy-6-hydroxymethyldihydropteridine diphosphokinase [Parvicella tangerina]|uniref:2-amino-4-hydroxy-6-hydroxymethyldihydropteridine pyrophosphokinase n=1 Tax=Parvicella tangerina TaxID=2829795 RepID=A0A916JPI9_9FLAO|nr:2-amino-4-hydroxy-6-hydroxymethyldihydropteridine diphosphokinase [Parvicella tangerina]CAG5086307.1 2-amino-4-hydroxy-6-hydroxymethyldihydropteridinepyrophosphokinase [Parvicella tangerina]